MKYVIFLFLANALIAQEVPKPQATAPVVSAMNSINKSILVIDPKARAHDYAQTFDQLRKDKPTLKIMVRTSSGPIMNVTDLSVAPGGTLLWLRILSTQGTRLQVVPIEEMMEITYSP